MTGWTVLFFIYQEDDETIEYSTRLVDELRRTKHSGSLNLLIFESTYLNENDGKIIGKLFELKTVSNNQLKRKKLLKNFGEVNPGEKNVLENALLFIKNNNLLLDHFMLFTWDHGSGFGIFDGDPRPKTEKLARVAFNNFLNDHEGTEESFASHGNKSELKVIRNQQPRYQFRENFEGKNLGFIFEPITPLDNLLQFQSPKINMLTATEINAALGILDRKTDLIIMMNCWMQLLETGGELAENAEILVAAETVHFFAGYDYESIINAIVDLPDIDGRKLASIAVRSVVGNFESEKIWKEHLKELIISAVDLRKIHDLLITLDAICKELINTLSNNPQEIKQIRGKCIDFTIGYVNVKNDYIDLLSYISNLNHSGLIDKAKFDSFHYNFRQYLIELYCGDNFTANGPLPGITAGNGCSVFHPDSKESFDDWLYYNYFYVQNRIRIARREWGNYLSNYRKKGNL
jgi:hypothetical protein